MGGDSSDRSVVVDLHTISRLSPDFYVCSIKKEETVPLMPHLAYMREIIASSHVASSPYRFSTSE
jgi:hypothetical protein